MSVGTADVIGGLLLAYNLFGHGGLPVWIVALPWIIEFFLAFIAALVSD